MLLDAPVLELLASCIPPPRKSSASRGDGSRSATAFRRGAALRRVGKTFEAMVEALRSDPETADWCREKGMALGMRELHRIWERADPPPTNNSQGHVGGADAEPWPEPADLLGGSIEPAPPFQINFLPGAFARFAGDAAERMQVPVDFIGVPLIIAAATLIGKGFRMAPKAADSWSERPCLWGGIVAEIGALKSPAFDAALAMLRQFQGDFHKEHEAAIEAYQAAAELAAYAEKSWKAACAKASKKGEQMPPKPDAARTPNEPIMRRLLTGDTTQEALVDLIDQNPRGMLLFRDELSGWFASFNQYRDGADRQFYLECHAGGSFAKDRRIGSVLIDDLYLNICGGIQPEIISRVLHGGDHDGMTARFSLLVWPEKPSQFRYIDRPPEPAATRAVERAFRELLQLDPEGWFGPKKVGSQRVFRFDDAAQGIFRDWYIGVRTTPGADYEKNMVAHIAKFPGLFARLAVTHHLMRYASDKASSAPGTVPPPMTVDVQTAEAVRTFIDDYLEPHARRIYRHLSRGTQYAGARKIAKWLTEEFAVDSFTARDISQKDWGGLTKPGDINAALYQLEYVAGWCRSKEIPAGPKGGRPTTRYVINPKIRHGR
jgi:Protein of unknown function (DUF3987)